MSKVSERLWQRMEELYGSAWSRKFGAEPNDSWIQMLESVKSEAIGAAIKECIKHNPHPPSLPEFGNYLRAFNKVYAEREQMEALPAPKVMTDKEVKMARDTIKKVAPKKPTPGNRRSVLLPDENQGDYQRKLAEAMNDGMTEADFRWKRLKANGWTEEDEKSFMLHLSSLKLLGRYGPKDSEHRSL